jgi:hypothetical protein
MPKPVAGDDYKKAARNPWTSSRVVRTNRRDDEERPVVCPTGEVFSCLSRFRMTPRKKDHVRNSFV